MKRILCFGDSNTWGLIAGTNRRYEYSERWTGRLQKAFNREEVQIIEEGLCGRTTVTEDTYRIGRAGSKLLPVLLESHSPLDLVVLMLGTNDCKYAYNPTAESIGDGIEVLLKQIRNYSKDCKILLISPIELGKDIGRFDKEFNDYSIEVSKGLPGVYQNIADKYEIDYLKASAYANPSDVDREHLDEEGHKKLAKAITDKVREIILPQKTLLDNYSSASYFQRNSA